MDDSNRITSDEIANPSEGKIEFWNGVLIALAVLAAQLIGGIIGVFIALPIVGLENMNQVTAIGTGIALIISFPLAVWWILRKRKLSTTAWKWNNSFFYLLVLSLILIYSVSYIVGGIIELIPGYENLLNQYQTMFEGINPTLLIIGGAFIGPICEEIIFRGIILKEFLKTYSPNKAIMYSSIIFGVIHFIPLQVISAFFAGLVLGYIYYKTKSLWLPIIMHILHNLIAFVFGLDTPEETGREWFGNDLYYLLSFALAGAIVYIIYNFLEKTDISVEDQSIT